MQWNNSHDSDVYSTLPQPENSGWSKRNESHYEIDCKDPSLQMVIEKTYHLLEGCKCKKGCGSKKCGCRQEERRCGPSCICVNCTNIQTVEMESIDYESCESSLESEEKNETEIITETNSFLDDLLII